MMLIFAGCLAIAASIFILRRKGTGPNGLRAKRLAARLVLTGSVGLFFSSAMLYVTYRPYAEILDRILKLDRDPRYADLFDRVLKGDMSGPYAEDLSRIVKVNSSGIDSLRSFLAQVTTCRSYQGLPARILRVSPPPELCILFLAGRDSIQSSRAPPRGDKALTQPHARPRPGIIRISLSYKEGSMSFSTKSF